MDEELDELEFIQTDKEIEESDLNQVAMYLILHAGDARNSALEAMSYARKKKFDKAYELIEDSQRLINKAHNKQTEVIQAFAAGKKINPNFLFIHAQDTLMTIKSEITIFSELIITLEQLKNDIL